MSFAHFRQLSELDLGYNSNLGFRNASRAWWGLQFTKIQSIVMSSITPQTMRPSKIEADFFDYLNLTKIKSLLLNRNDLIYIAPRFSETLPHLIHIKLKENRLSNADELIADFAKLDNLTTLDLSYQLNPSPAYRLTNDKGLVMMKLVNDGYGFQNADINDYTRTKKKYPTPACVTANSLKDCPVRWDSQNETRRRVPNKYLPQKNIRLDIDPICVPIAKRLQSLDLTEAIRVPLHTLKQTIIFGGKFLKYIQLDYNSLQSINGPIIFTEPPTDLFVSLTNNQLTCLAPDLFYNSTLNGSFVTALRLSNNRLGQQLDHDALGRTFSTINGSKI
jgi:hypothetical protein